MKIKTKIKLGSKFRAFPLAAINLVTVLLCLAGAQIARAQNCQTATELAAAAHTAISATGQHYFDQAVKGDTASLRQSAISSLASDFSGVEATVKDSQANLTGAQATPKSMFLLEADGTAPLAHVDFYCGVFGTSGQTADSAVFSFDNLPPGKYAVVLLDATSSKGKTSFAAILQQAGSDWKLAGLFIKPAQLVGHDSAWFANQARQFKASNQLHDAWLFFLQARALATPLPVMSTQATDKLYDESQSLLPADVPANGKTVDLAAGSASYKLTAMFPQAVGDDLDLIVRYQVPTIADTNQTYQSNVAVMKALVAKFPELKDAFAGVVARAVDPSGHDYGTMLAMKDIK
jgi:hypothetical protein